MFEPVNRHLLIRRASKKNKEESLIVLPEDYKPEEERYVMVEVLAVSKDARFEVSTGDKLIVDRAMIEQIKIEGTNYDVVLDNYVVGIV